MNWSSVSDFLAMGGYGFYVWSSFGACALAMLAECLSLRQREKQVKARLRRQVLADQLDQETPA